MRLARRLANRDAWCGRAALKPLTMRVKAAPVPARMSTGCKASHTASMRIIAAGPISSPRTRRPCPSALLRQAIHERTVARALQAKVGRNERRMSSSGKKFKNYRGAQADLH